MRSWQVGRGQQVECRRRVGPRWTRVWTAAGRGRSSKQRRVNHVCVVDTDMSLYIFFLPYLRASGVVR